MSPSVQIETAFTFLDVLQQMERERQELEDWLDDNPAPGVDASAAWDETEKVVLIANATWVGKLIDSDMLAIIEAYLKDAPLIVRRNAFSCTVSLATSGVTSGLREAALKQQRERQQATEGQFSTVEPDTFKAMVREGLVDWTVRTAADEGYEIRSCTQCGKWFEPQLKSRSRFCSQPCRKSFNNLRNSGNEDLTIFKCAGCGERRAMDEFAGLRFLPGDSWRATPLRMGRYFGGSKNMCCVNCIRTKFPEWRRYIAPMESLSERVMA